MPNAAEWKKIDSLVDEQKFEAAAARTEALLKSARDSGDEAESTRALIRLVQLRTGLHGYETAVRFLREQPWPKGALQRAAVELFYAHSLITYLDGYSWEIRQRERVESKGPVDLKSWTAEQIVGEAQRAYLEIWKMRDSLGNEPIDALSEYVQPNNYPSGIRGTLRDAVTYFWVDLLANTSHWRPEQSNDLFRLDLKTLVKGDPQSSSVKLDDPAVHPLIKIGALLDDLENWHSQHGQPEGALEARLERERRLFGSFTDVDQRNLIRADLEARLPAFSKLSWWSMGMGTVADFWMEQGDLARAHQVASEGVGAFPKSIGAQKCHSLVEQIEAPDFSLTSMLSDGLHRRSVQVRHKNMATVTFRAYRIDLDERISAWRDYNLLPQGDELKGILQHQKAVAEWTASLPATPDFQEHATYVTPKLDHTGLYLIAASAAPTFPWQRNRIQSAYLLLSDLVMTIRDEQNGEYEVRVLHGDSGEGDSKAQVELHMFDWNTKHKLVRTYTANSQGYVRVARPPSDSGSYFLIAKRGDQRAISLQAIGFYQPEKPQAVSASLVYTDRSVYRPMQKVFWKVVAYQGRPDRSSYQTLPNSSVTVALFDANNQKVDEKKLQTNGFGSAAGEFTIPAGRLLGGWRVTSQPAGAAAIRVEEYKRPTFEVSMKDPETALRLNKPATLVGEAHYYFGLPVTSGQVRWLVTREALYPYWWGWFGMPQIPPQVMGSGTATLGDDGKFRFTFTPEVDDRTASVRDISYSYAVSAEVTDEGGETRSASRAFRLGLVAVEASINLKVGFLLENATSEAVVTRTDLDGVPRPGKGSWRLSLLRQPDRARLPADELPPPRPALSQTAAHPYQTEGDALRARWDSASSPDAVMHFWTAAEERAKGTTTHGARGDATVTLPPLPAGAYRLEYETVDDFGAKYSTNKDFVVGAASSTLALPAALFLEQSSVPVGGTARLLMVSGLPEQTMVLDIFRGVHGHERRFITVGKDSALVELPIGDDDRGGFSVTLTALRDYQLLTLSQSVFVPWDNKELSLEFATFRDRIRPGNEETWRVKVKGPHGTLEKGTVELLAYMYDQALDLFAPHSPPSISALYPSRARSYWTRSTLGPQSANWVVNEDFANIVGWPGLIGDRLKFLEGYGIGGLGLRGAGPGGGGFGGRMRMTHAPMRSAAIATGAAPPAPPAGEPVAGKVLARAESGIVDAAKPALKTPGQPSTTPAPAPDSLRSEFSETAFWQPQLLTDSDGAAVIQFKVPDSVTAWDVWVHAMTRDLTGGSLSVHTKSVKDLMVRPYLPRFMREGDKAAIRVVLNNASDHELKGEVAFEIQDPETHADLADAFKLPPEMRKPRTFTIAAGKSAHLEYPLTAPNRLGPVAFKVVAHAGDFSDGELRSLPILPSRIHLAQSRFVTLHNQDKRVMKFEDLARDDDPSRINEQLVVTVDAQLFYSVLQALPYLVNYPYECTEQTMNRFVSTGIVSSIYAQYPAVAKMAQQMGARQTPLETWDGADPNRKMTLEESPWLELARGGTVPGQELLNVLDPKITAANRQSSLGKLRKAQTAIGAFPWWPGGPPSPYMTLYIAHGLARAAEYHVDFPKEVTQRAWSYLARHFRDEYIDRMRAKKADWEFLTFLNFVASSYPDASYTGDALTLDERTQILDYSFAHWKQHSPYLKGYLALTLKRMGRPKDADLVFESVMDSAKTTADQGTFWAPEDRSWLWYNDTIESHAFALRALMELHPKDPRRDGLVQWLLLNKKLSQWKSTRATAEVIYALVKYLESEGALGARENATVTVGPKTVKFVFEPDAYTGKKNQVVVPGPEVNAQTSSVTVEKTSKGFAFASATWQFSTEKLPTEDRGDFFSVSRRYFRREKQAREVTLQPLTEGAKVKAGDEVEVQISLRSKHAAEYVHLRDPRAAGLEPENAVSRYKWDLGIGWYEEVRDSGTNFFFELLPAGEYTFKYRVRANLAGTFRVGPATVQSLYAPEFNAYSAGAVLEVANE